MRVYDEDDLKDLNAEQWMIDLVKLNEHYVSWGCDEDYMCGEDAGWRTRSILDSFEEMWDLDNLNECVNYYFEVERDSIDCNDCNGIGLNPKTKKLSDDYYDFNRTGGKWYNKITQDEVEALVKNGRLTDFTKIFCHHDKDSNKWIKWVDGIKKETAPPIMPTAEEVNIWAEKGIGHDGINRCILIETRAKRLGFYGHCDKCNGQGYIYITEKARLALQLWILHPRKGCSRGVYIKNIVKKELPKVKQYLLEAKNRNNNRFKNIDLICKEL